MSSSLTGLAPSVTFAENTVNATPQLLDGDVAFTTSGSLAGGRLVVRGLLAEDRVSILHQGIGAGQIGVSDTAISYGGVAIGTASGGMGSAFTVTFNSAVTGAAVDALIQRLAYANVSDVPTATRTLTLDVVDASGVRVNGVVPTFTEMDGSANPFNGIIVVYNSTPSFVDLDSDGRLDLVSGEGLGMLLAWRNTGSATAPAFTALTGSANPFNGIDLGFSSAPSFVDLDGDGRLDLVAGELNGTLRAWRNTGSATAPAFTALTGSANPFNGIDVGYWSTPSFVDLDGDGRLDLVSGAYDGTLRAWRNTGSATAPAFTALIGSANPFNGIDVGFRSSPSFVDLDGDGRLDLVSGERNGALLAWRNTGSAAAPAFTVLTGSANPFNGIDVGYTSTPSFVDLDGDGLLDLIAGEGSGTLLAWRNTTPLPSITVTVTAENDPPTLTGFAPSVTFAENTVNATPQLIDSNVVFTAGDSLAGGRLVVAGLLAEDRVSILTEGSGAGQIGVSGSAISYGGVAIGTASGGQGSAFTVTFNSAVTGEAVDALIQRLAYANLSDTPTTTRTLTLDVVDASGVRVNAPLAPAFTALTDSANPFNGIDVGFRSAPSFVDLDNDGLLDLVSGEEYGTLRAWRNTGSATAPAFTELTGSANPFNGFDVGVLSTPSFVDLDGDGRLDLVSGEGYGMLLAWRNTGSATAPAFTALTGSANPFNGIDVGFWSTPSFVDLDNDGLLDLVSGEFFGTLRVWRNTGSATAPAFTALTGSANPFNGIDVGWISAPSFVDLDGNGRLDLVSGEEYGTLLAWRNTGSATAPAFTALTGSANPFNRIDVGRFSTPSFVDLDSDGRLDLVSGENFGTLRAWRNTTPLPSITVSVTAENDAPTGAVNIVNHGDTLRATNTLNDAEGVGVVSYAWQSSTDAGATWQAIPGASSADLALGASLSGMVVRVVASYVDGRGTPEAVASGGARIGTASADVLTAGAGISILLGFGGNDSLTGAAGSDLLDAGDGADTLVGGSGASQRVHGSGGGDSVLGGSGLGQWLYGGAGHDTMQAGSGNGQELWGAWDNDSIMGGEAFAAYMNGESGDDTLVGGNGASQALLGDIGEDSLVGGSGNGQGLDAGDGADTLVGGSGASQRVHGSGGGDSVLGGSGLGQWLYGGAGHDTMLAGSGNGQELWGAWDNDSIMGGEAFAAYMNGESGDDTLVGGNGASQALLGDIGEDSLVGGSGNGQGLIGGDGNDTLRAGSGTGQVLFGGTGQDSLAGSSSADSLLGEDGNDTLAGGLGADTMDGGAGSDDWVSYAGATEAIGAAIVPSLQPGHWGGAAGDSLVGIENILGSNFDDGITGDSGTNILNGGLGADSLFAEGGDDSLIGGEGNDLLGGSGGSDWAIYADATSGVAVDVFTGRASGAHGADTLDNIENVLGGIGDDSILGDSLANILSGSAGNDTLAGGLGADTMDGGAGSDDWVSYAGATEAIGAAIVPSLQPGHWGGAAGDSLVGIENILGSNFDDGITGDSGTNILNGGLGADSLFAEGGDDSLIGGEGNDLLGGSGGSDWAIYADAASGATVDLITGRASGAHGADTLDDIENVLGGIGDDSLLGDGGDNTLVGGSGNDTLIGGAGNDALDGNAGNDWLDFGAGTESVTYALGMGNDTLDGGAGTDFLKLSAGTWTSGTDGAWTTLIQGSTRLYVRNWENIGAANIALTPLAEDTPVTLTTAGLLAGWSGGNGTTLSVLNLTASSGTLTNLGNGSWGFQGATNDDTSVTFSYQVSDGTVAIAATATLDLTPVNDAPVITSGTTASFAENGTGIAYQAVVSDPEGATLTWSLGGADADLFNISSSGAVTFKTAPNFEAPGDAGTNNLYDITVTASDGALSTSRNVAITVTNVNDVAPSITSGTTASFAENGTGTVYQAAGSDPEGATLTWSLGGTDAALFNISSSGAVTFKTAPNFEAPGDVGSNNVYDIIVTASDGALTASRNVAITVTDVNDVAPSISSGSTANFAENGTGIAYQAVGADPDAGTVLSWTLGGTDADLFNISSSGAVTFKAAPDFEAPADAGGNNVYDITVTASDGALSSLARAVTIAVTDVREIATLTGFAPSVTFAENTVNATPQLIDSNVVFTAGDSLAGGRLVVAGLLAEDRVSILSEGTGAGQIGVSGSAINFGGVTIGTASGGVGNDFTVTFNTAVTGAAVDALIQRLAYGNVSSAPTATRTLTLDVVDAAGGHLAATPTPQFTALTGTANPFNGIGVVSDSAPSFVDLDADGRLDLVLGAADGTLLAWRNTGSGFTALTGTANPFNGIDVGSNSTPSFVDLDSDGRLDLVSGAGSRTLLAWRNTGTATAPIFTALTGTANPFDRIDPGGFNAPSFVDLDGDGLLDLVSGEFNGTLRAWRNTGSGFTALTGTANPFDGIGVGQLSKPSFVDLDGDGRLDLVSGAGGGTLRAWRNTDSGFTALTGTANPFNGFQAFNRNTPSFVDLDGDGRLDLALGGHNGTLLAWRNTTPLPSITVSVTAENDPPIVTSGAAASFAENGTGTAYQAVGSDPEGTTMSWSLGGADQALFNINATTGAVTFVTAPNFEEPGDAGGDNVYDITVTASDGALSTSRDVAITVTNVNEAPSGSVSFSHLGGALRATNTLSDADGLGVISHAWQSSGDAGVTWQAISGATSADFTPDAAVAGRLVRVVASYLDGSGTAESVASGGMARIGTSGADSLTAGAGVTALFGLGGSDTLTGTAASQTLAGGAGDDMYLLHDSLDFVLEGSGGGTDTIMTWMEMTLPDHVEMAVVAPDVSGITVTGSAGNDMLIGNGLSNNFNGGAGDDVILAGNVTLADIYALFNT